MQLAAAAFRGPRCTASTRAQLFGGISAVQLRIRIHDAYAYTRARFPVLHSYSGLVRRRQVSGVLPNLARRIESSFVGRLDCAACRCLPHSADNWRVEGARASRLKRRMNRHSTRGEAFLSCRTWHPRRPPVSNTLRASVGGNPDGVNHEGNEISDEQVQAYDV